MRAHVAGLLLVAAAHSVSAAVRWEILNRRAPAHLPPNATAVATPAVSTTTQDTTSFFTTNELFSSLSAAAEPNRSSSASIAIPNEERTTSDIDHDTSSSTPRTRSNPSTFNHGLTNPDSLTDSTAIYNSQSATASSILNSTSSEQPDGGRRITANGEGRPPSTPESATTPATNTTRELGSTTTPSRHASFSSSWNGTQSQSMTTRATSWPQSDTCTVLRGDEPVTVFSIVFTATITLYGNQSYTPPYPTIETPNYCGTGSSLPPKLSLSNEPFISSSPTPTSGGLALSTKHPAASCSEGHAESGCLVGSAPDSSPSSESDQPKQGGETFSSSRVTVTFVTTDKNPATVFPSEPVPRFRQSGMAGSITAQQHKSARPSGGARHGPQSQEDSQSQDESRSKESAQSQDESRSKDNTEIQDDPKTLDNAESLEQQSQTTFTVTARGEQVIINDETFSSLRPDQTTTVTVSRGTFTINPTEVIGEGATVKKPRPVGTAVTVLTPTTAIAGGLTVTVSGSEAVVDGTKMDIPPLGTTAVVNGETISVGPGKVVVDDETVTFRAVGGHQTDVVVTGGEMVTAIGQSIYIFHSTTLTYGPGIPERSEVVDDDTITIGPSGVAVDGTTMGGTSADATDTTYEIVGGATITKLSPSFVLIDGTTFTVGPKATKVTKVIGGETVTIGPDGVIISSMTLTYPFGSSTVTTIKATGTRKSTQATETGRSGSGSDDNEDNAGYLLQPSLAAAMTGLCIAIGVWVWL